MDVQHAPTAVTESRERHSSARLHGRWLLLGPDCSINPDTPEPLLEAAGAAARETRPD